MATKSVAHQIIDAIMTRLETIRIGDGFNTDAGWRVYWARRHVDAESIVVWRQNEAPDDPTRNTMQNRLTLSIEGHVDADQESTGQQLEYLLADIKKAVFLATGESRYLILDDVRLAVDLFPTGVNALAREDGDTTEAVQVLVDVQYPEQYGDPYKVFH